MEVSADYLDRVERILRGKDTELAAQVQQVRGALALVEQMRVYLNEKPPVAEAPTE